MKIKKKTLQFMVFIAIVIIAIGSLSYFTSRPEVTSEDFAVCIGSSDAIMYGTYWCSHCKAQKQMFGDSFKYVNYVECTEEQDRCTDAGVKGYPSWIINGELYEGQQPLERLASLTGCELDQ